MKWNSFFRKSHIYFMLFSLNSIACEPIENTSFESLAMNYYENVSKAQAKYRDQLAELILKSDSIILYQTKFDYASRVLIENRDKPFKRYTDEYSGNPDKLIRNDNLLLKYELKEKAKLAKLRKMLSKHLKKNNNDLKDGILPFYVIECYKENNRVCSIIVSIPSSELSIRYPDLSVSHMKLNNELADFLIKEIPIEKEMKRFIEKYPSKLTEEEVMRFIKAKSP